jgi:tape measure domain-containing protein
MAVIENLDVVLGAKTQQLDKEIDKELKSIAKVRETALAGKKAELEFDADLRRAQESRRREKEAADRQVQAAALQAAKVREAADLRHDARLKQYIALKQSVMTGEEKHAEAINRYQKMRDRGNISQETYNRLVQKSIDLNMRLDSSMSQRATKLPPGLGGDGASAGGGINVAAMAARYAGPAAIAMAAKSAIMLTANVETSTVAFEVLTGSAEEATRMIASMRKLDAESPLNFMDLQQAGKTLMGFGESSGNVMGDLEALGAVAMGDGERMKSLALAMGQVVAAGRLTGQEVLQMVNAGFNPLQVISEKTGKSMAQLRDEMADGQISVQMVRDALAAATSEGGRFYGMNEKLAKTTSGTFAKMISEVQTLGINIGGLLSPIAKVGAETVKLSASGWNQIFDGIKSMIPESLEDRIARVSREMADAAGSFQSISESAEKTAKSTAKWQSMQDRLAAEAGGKDFQDKIAEIEEQYRKMQVGEEEFQRLQLEGLLKNNDLSAEDRAKGVEALRQLESIKYKEQFDKRKEEEDELKKQAEETAKQKLEQDKQRADAIKQGAQTEQQRLAESIREIKSLESQGLLSSTDAQAAAARAVGQSGLAKAPTNVGAVSAQSGSVEAYKLLLTRENEKKKADTEAAKARALTNKLLADAVKHLASANPIKAIR